MSGVKLDGAGNVKMATLDAAIHTVATLHSTVERMAVAMKGKANINQYTSTFKRTAVPLVGQLKGQFGMISDQVANVLLVTTRTGGGDVARLRGMREGVAGIKVALEIAVNKTKEKHAESDHKPSDASA